MGVKLLFFAQCADWVGRRAMDVPLQGPTSVETLVEANPELKPVLDKRSLLKVAINEEFAEFSTEVRDGDEVAFLPPVCGG